MRSLEVWISEVEGSNRRIWEDYDGACMHAAGKRGWAEGAGSAICSRERDGQWATQEDNQHSVLGVDVMKKAASSA